ncbi:MAG: glycosyltransferase family 4 protein [Candidatus Thorarchaeota archaeon]|nr:glycosyltransferase family 4 protein [Candidatus Thorarchaeota archaeon]
MSQSRLCNLSKIPGKPFSEALALSREVEEVVFLCYNEEGKYLSKRINTNLYVYTVPFRMKGSLLRTLVDMVRNLLFMSIFAAKITRKHRINMIRAENIILGGIPVIMSRLFQTARFAIWLAGSEDRVIRIRYGGGFLSKITLTLFRCIRKYILSRAEFVVTVSDSCLAGLSRSEKKDIIHTPNFVDLESFTPSINTQRNNPFVFLYVGRLEHEKGVVELLSALRRIKSEKRFILKFTGWGTLQGEVECAANEDSRIVMLGKLPHSDLPSVYQDADMLVLPSLTEGMPAVVLEAMASGIPVLATRVGQVPDVVSNGEHGLLVDSGSPEQLADAMIWAIENQTEIDKMKTSVRRKVVDLSGGYLELHKGIYRDLFGL